MVAGGVADWVEGVSLISNVQLVIFSPLSFFFFFFLFSFLSFLLHFRFIYPSVDLFTFFLA